LAPATGADAAARKLFAHDLMMIEIGMPVRMCSRTIRWFVSASKFTVYLNGNTICLLLVLTVSIESLKDAS